MCKLKCGKDGYAIVGSKVYFSESAYEKAGKPPSIRKVCVLCGFCDDELQRCTATPACTIEITCKLEDI